MLQAGSRQGEGEGETLMGEVAAPPSYAPSRYHHQPYTVGVVPFAGIALPLTHESYPTVYRAPAYVSIPYNKGPASFVPPPFYTSHSKNQDDEKDTPRQRSKLARRLLLGGKILFLALLVMAMFMPMVVKLHDGILARAEARRVYTVRVIKHRTAFHFQPALNWMNDPNGLMYYQGYYHLFYQYNPEAPVWGNIVWGHAVSTDLVHWRHLEPALRGDQWYDMKGVWSGSATVLPDGTPVLMYTGWSETSDQMQCMAFPADRNDPLLRQWVKAPQNPVAVVPLGYNASQFRDPSTAWQGSDQLWRLLVGAKKEEGALGTALLYKSTDFQTWNFSHALHSVPGTGMWECPDFFPVPVFTPLRGAETSTYGPTVKHVLKISSNDKRHDYYTVGTYVNENDTFLPATAENFGLRYDYGKLFASKSFHDPSKNRRILFGWVNESNNQAASVYKGWASVMSVPRQVWLDNRTTSGLMQYPVEELSLLRNLETSQENVTVGAGSFVELESVSGNQLDIEVSFAMPKTGQFQAAELLPVESGQQACTQSKNGYLKGSTVIGPFGVYVLATEDLQELTAIYFHVLQSPAGEPGLKILVCSDQSQSSVASNLDKQAFGSFVRVYKSDEFLTLRILVDHSIVETFVQGGRTVITSRVYPEHAVDDDAHLFLFNNGPSPITARSIRVWNMNSVDITPFS